LFKKKNKKNKKMKITKKLIKNLRKWKENIIN